jgi:hypothetical protein
MPLQFDRIEGWFNFNEIYEEVVNAAPEEGAHFVEFGVLKGASAAHMASLIYDSNKKIQFDAVDWFKGSVEFRDIKGVFPDGMEDVEKRTQWLYELAKSNLKPATDLGLVNVIKKSVKEAIVDYADESLDFVYHDASHEYEDLMEELPLIWNKVKPGGYMAGHDYSNWGFPGVARAVNLFAERVGRLHVIFRSGEDTWVIKKPLREEDNSKLDAIPQSNPKQTLIANLKACIKLVESQSIERPLQQISNTVEEKPVEPPKKDSQETKRLPEDFEDFSYLV